MLFRTEFSLPKSTFNIAHNSSVFMMGSCFSEHIGAKLSERKFKVLSNPYGILFNPASIARALHDIIDKSVYKVSDLVENNGIFHSLSHHGRFSGIDAQSVLNQINNDIATAHNFLKTAEVIFITYGTAWAYSYNVDSDMKGSVVGNCHKLPASNFTKQLLDVETIVNDFKQLTEKLRNFNENAQIVFTLSPVRHLRDGFEENQISKSVLRLAIHNLVESLDKTSYFPAYELIIDDLRDYRFFEEDMVHPNKQAVNYVWEKFAASFFDESTIAIIKKIEQFTAAINHRPQFPESEAHQKFIAKLNNEIARFETETGIIWNS